MLKNSAFLILAFFCTAHAEFSGRVRGEGQLFLDKQIGSAPQGEAALNLEAEEHLALDETWKLKIEPRVRVSSVPHMADSFDGDMRDTLIEKKFRGLRVQAGSFLKVWEGTDGLNPMDIASVRNYRDPLNADSIASVGVNASYNFAEGWTIEALYVPWQTPTRLPGDNSPWWPRKTSLPVEVQNTQLLLPSGAPAVQIDHHETLNSALKDNAGGRLQYHAETWDASAAMFEGAAQIPIFQPILNGDLVESSPKTIIQLRNPVEVRPIEYRRRTWAAAGSKTLGSWIIRVAGRYDQPIGNEPLVPGWSEEIVGGFEHSFSVRSQNLTFVSEYAYEDQAPVTTSILASPDPFRRALLVGLRAPVTDDLLFFLSGIVDTEKGSSLARLNVTEKFGGHWSVGGTAEWLRGTDDTLLGLWKSQSRVAVNGTYQF